MICPKCGAEFAAPDLRSINIAKDPSLKDRVKDGSLFMVKCPRCGSDSLVQEPVLYHDPSQRLLIAYTSAGLSSDGLEGYTCRLVGSIGELIEKVKVFDAGLDDIALELLKYVTAQELKKDVALKFLKMDGADGEITLTYPEKGEMQMLVVGYNVYSDCVGIVERNPVLREHSSGLVSIDQSWVSQFIAG
ncbi:MAG: CpXC domain-containing protein [Bacteroidales bacterium]|nr:CpXC domain-containing protein [Bacteroidales bacterium]